MQTVRQLAEGAAAVSPAAAWWRIDGDECRIDGDEFSCRPWRRTGGGGQREVPNMAASLPHPNMARAAVVAP